MLIASAKRAQWAARIAPRISITRSDCSAASATCSAKDLLGAAIFALVWPLRHRLRRPGDLAWLVLGLFAAGRLFEFFLRSDSPELALGFNNGQWTSLGLLLIVAIGWTLTAKRAPGRPPQRSRAGEGRGWSAGRDPLRPSKLSRMGGALAEGPMLTRSSSRTHERLRPQKSVSFWRGRTACK